MYQKENQIGLNTKFEVKKALLSSMSIKFILENSTLREHEVLQIILKNFNSLTNNLKVEALKIFREKNFTPANIFLIEHLCQETSSSVLKELLKTCDKLKNRLIIFPLFARLDKIPDKILPRVLNLFHRPEKEMLGKFISLLLRREDEEMLKSLVKLVKRLNKKDDSTIDELIRLYKSDSWLKTTVTSAFSTQEESDAVKQTFSIVESIQDATLTETFLKFCKKYLELKGEHQKFHHTLKRLIAHLNIEKSQKDNMIKFIEKIDIKTAKSYLQFSEIKQDIALKSANLKKYILICIACIDDVKAISFFKELLSDYKRRFELKYDILKALNYFNVLSHDIKTLFESELKFIFNNPQSQEEFHEILKFIIQFKPIFLREPFKNFFININKSYQKYYICKILEAAEALKIKETPETLKSFLQSNHPEVVIKTLNFISNLKIHELINSIKQLLNAKNPLIVKATLLTLAELNSITEKEIRLFLNKNDFNIKTGAVMALLKVTDLKKVLNLLNNYFNTSPLPFKIELIDYIFKNNYYLFLSELFNRWQSLALGVKKKIEQNLEEYKPTYEIGEFLKQYLGIDSTLDIAIIKSLANNPNKFWESVFIEALLSSKKFHFLRSVLFNLKTYQQFIEELKSYDPLKTPVSQYKSSLDALATLKDKHSTEDLIILMNSTKGELRKLFIKTIGEIGGKKAVNELLKLLRLSEKEEKLIVAEALKNIADLNCILPLIQASSTNDWEIKSVILEILRSFGKDNIEKIGLRDYGSVKNIKDSEFRKKFEWVMENL